MTAIEAKKIVQANKQTYKHWLAYLKIFKENTILSNEFMSFMENLVSFVKQGGKEEDWFKSLSHNDQFLLQKNRINGERVSEELLKRVDWTEKLFGENKFPLEMENAFKIHAKANGD